MTRRRESVAAALGSVVISVALVAPFFFSRGGTAVPSTHDMAQHVSVLLQFDDAVRAGSMYPRWQHEFNNGYGLPWLNYYPPGFYYVAELFYALLRNWISALFACCVILMAASGFAFHRLARELCSPFAAAIGMLFYLFAPYRTIDLYWRGALPELTGFLFIPLVLLFALKAGRDGTMRNVGAVGLFLGLYLISHFPVAYLTMVTLAFYAVIWSLMRRDYRPAARIGAGVALSLVVSAIYWIPALLEMKYVRQPFSTTFPYHSSYVTLMPGGDIFNHAVNRTFVALALTLIVCMAASRTITTSQQQLRLIGWIAVASLFMITPYSVYISRLIPRIDSVSFAWRWLLVASCAVALMVAAAIDGAFAKRNRALVALVIAVVVIHSWQTVRLMRTAMKAPDLKAPLNRQEAGFVPAGAAEGDGLPDTERIIASPPSTQVTVLHWTPLQRSVEVRGEVVSAIRFKTFVFPGWRAHVDSRPQRIDADSTGAQIVHVPPGLHRISVTFDDTSVRKVGMTISLIGSVLAVGMMVLTQRPRTLHPFARSAISSRPGSEI